MRIVVHAGLHKSGTTTVQAAWQRAFSASQDVWYPTPRWSGPGHAALMSSMVELDLTVRLARARGVGVLLLSSESLARFRSERKPALLSALGGEPETVLLTVTRPAHRWVSGWQEAIKHGETRLPMDFGLDGGVAHLTSLARFLQDFPGDRVVIRLVRNEPPEPDLAATVTRALGLPDARIDVSTEVHNISLGVVTELLRRLNVAGRTAGLALDEHRQLLGRLAPTWTRIAPQPGSEDGGFRVPEGLRAAAAEEALALRDLANRPRFVLDDPHGLLEDWDVPSLPPWFLELREGAWALDGLPTAEEGAVATTAPLDELAS